MEHQYDVFISYNSNDQALVTPLATRLTEQGLKVFLDRWHLVPGQPWPEHLRTVLSSCAAVAICVGPGEMGPWQLREMYFALDRQNREPGFPVVPLLLPNANPPLDFLSQNMWVDFRGGIEEQMPLSILLAAVRRETLDPLLQQRLQESIDSVCPYRGLHFFREQDAAFFFGRDEAVEQLQDKLRQSAFVALVGASGAGKSSVVRAGLLPRLRQDTREPWEIVTMVPGDRPLHNLASGLLPLLEPEMSENRLLIEIGAQAQAFLDGTLQIRDVVERILKKQIGTAHFLLVVDQWEELYTLAQSDRSSEEGKEDRATAQHNMQVKFFIDGLLEACEAGGLRVVLTMRGDFMGHVISYRPLSDRLQNAQINLGPMREEELRQAIEAPAKKLNSRFEAGLVDALLTEVGDEPGNLPLLEFVLERLWEDKTHTGGLLRYQAYRDMGKLKGALTQKADALYSKLKNNQEREQLRHILMRLVHSHENTDYTRKRAHFDKLDPLIQQLIEERLLVSNQDKDSRGVTVEVAHEALIRDWPQYNKWLREDRDFLLWRERLDSAHKSWLGSGDSSDLLTGQHLLDARRWCRLKQKELAASEKLFIHKSSRHARWAVVRKLSMVMAPLLLTFWFFLWSSSNDFSPKLGFFVLLSKLDIYTLQPDMVMIPPDKDCQKDVCEFLMGSDASDESGEQPQHRVRFNKNFKIGRYEVTFDEYLVFAIQVEKDGGCKGDYRINAINDSGFGKGIRPVINVSLEDTQCYAQWLSIKTGKKYRLPTGAEWEYAARAGKTGAYYLGDEYNVQKLVWFAETSDRKTQPVGEKKPNAFGLYDMSGNVEEWVLQVCGHDNYENAPEDGAAWEQEHHRDCGLRVACGGSWYGRPAGLHSVCIYRPLGNRYINIGFRLAQDLP